MKWLAMFVCLLTLGVSFAQESEFDPQIEEAMKLSERGEHLEAYAQLSTIIQERPYFPEAYYYRSLVRERAGDLEGALTDTNVLLELDPLHTEGLFARGTLRFRLKQFDLALVDFSNLLDLPPGSTNTIVYQRKGYQQGVSGVFTQQGTDRAYIYENIGLCHLELGNWQEARRYLDLAISLHPETADYFLHRGRTYEMAGDTLNAKGDFMKALEINPYHPMAHQYLAALANATGDWASAEHFYDQAIEDQPDFALSYKQRGYQRLRSGKWAEAMEDFDAVLTMSPDDAEAMKYKAYVLQKLNLPDQALALYDRAISLDPLDPQAYFSKGNILYKKKLYAEALAAYTLSLYYQPNMVQALYQRALVYHYLGKKLEACQDMQKAASEGMKDALNATARICK